MAEPQPCKQPLLIAVDAAISPASTSVHRGEEVCALRTAPADQHTDAWLQPAIDECLGQLGIELPEIDGFAVTVGPGRFTGIRVGLATCLGLAAPRCLPVIAVLTLEALADVGRARATWVVPCLDARRGQLYAAVYHLRDAPLLPLRPVEEPIVCDLQGLARLCSKIGEPYLVIGSGSKCLVGTSSVEPAVFSANLQTVEETGPLSVPTGQLAARSWSTSDPSTSRPPTPVYLRPPDIHPPRNPLAPGP
ncbi:MAG: tRNA (adenosine(37)-N6)-threonylcarbamoyltransferase complex dimerization subunit type 1 TsaB [Acidobacteriota bacterium]